MFSKHVATSEPYRSGVNEAHLLYVQVGTLSLRDRDDCLLRTHDFVLGGVMATGDNPGVGFGWGAYRNEYGAIQMKSTSNKTFSLSHENCRYIDTIAKGHKSAAVNTALTWYRGQGVEVHELLANIAALQARLRDMHEQGEAPESTPPMGGWRAILARMWPF